MKKGNLLLLVGCLGLATLAGCSNRKMDDDNETFWKFYDSLNFRPYDDTRFSFDSVSKAMKEEANKSIIFFMSEIRYASYKSKFNADSTESELVYSDSLKTIYIYESDSLQIKLDKLFNKYSSNYLAQVAGAYFYNRLNDYKNERECLIKAYKEEQRPEILILLGDNASSLYLEEYLKPGGSDTSKQVKLYAKEKLNYYDSAVKIDPMLYTGLLRTAESLYAKGKTQKKDTDQIKELISRAIDVKPKWTQAFVVMSTTKSQISLMEHEDIYNKQIALGDSTQLYQLAIQKLNYNAQASLDIYRKTYKISQKSFSNASDESFLFFSMGKVGAADSVLRAMIKTIRKDTVNRHDQYELTDLYLAMAYQSRVYGRYAKALAYIDSCLLGDTTYFQGYAAEKVMILVKSEKKKEAIKYMDKYLASVKAKYSSISDTTELATRLSAFDQLRGYYDLK